MDKVQEYAAERPDPTTKKEQVMEDVDLFALSESGDALVVHPKWLQHLEQRQMGDNSRICKVTERGLETDDTTDSAALVDCPRGGLVLDWVFHKIVNTAEKARTSAQTVLCGGAMSKAVITEVVQEVYGELTRYLGDHAALLDERNRAKDMLADILHARKERCVEPGPEAELSTRNAAIRSRLSREERLVAAKLILQAAEVISQGEMYRSTTQRLAKSHPEYKRLQAELEDLERQAPMRSVEGTFRTAAELERHKTAMADQAGKERMELVQELKQRGVQLNVLVEQRDQARRCEEVADRERRQLETWRGTLLRLIGQLDGPEESAAHAREKVATEVAKQLYTDEEDIQLFDQLKTKVRDMDRRLDRGTAALIHQEMRLLNLCCYDPGASIGQYLALPFLQDTIFNAAEKQAMAAAQEAEDAILKQVQAERERKAAAAEAEKKRREAARQRAQERKAAEVAGRDAAKRAEPGSAHAGAECEAAERARARAVELEARRKAENDLLEAALEARRRQLMEEPDGHWKLRSEQAALELELAQQEDSIKAGEKDSKTSSSGSDGDSGESRDGWLEKGSRGGKVSPRLQGSPGGLRHLNGGRGAGPRVYPKPFVKEAAPSVKAVAAAAVPPPLPAVPATIIPLAKVTQEAPAAPAAAAALAPVITEPVTVRPFVSSVTPELAIKAQEFVPAAKRKQAEAAQALHSNIHAANSAVGFSSVADDLVKARSEVLKVISGSSHAAGADATASLEAAVASITRALCSLQATPVKGVAHERQ